jgi:Secretion system C-terminal sorting domain
MSTKRFLFLAVLLCGFGTNVLRAQGLVGWPEWMNVGWAQFDNTTALYFIAPLNGVAAANGGLYYTTPGHWNRSTTPVGIGLISSIRSIQGKLYAASQGTDVLVSTDSGQSWQFSGLNLNNANDVYADGNGTIRILTDPMTRFARIDTLDCVATGNGSIFRSTDGGQNWVSVVTGNDPISTGVFGDSCNHVFIAPYSSGTACLRSTDSGQTWNTVLTGASAYPEFIYGASTVPYLSDTGGLFRSTDDGMTWTSIITVTGGPHVMCVWGPMGEHAALNWNIEIWMTTTGGDDNLHSGVAMTDSNGAPLMQDDTFNVPFRLVSSCNNFLIPIPLEADVDGVSEKVSIASNNRGDVTLLGADSAASLPIGQTDTLWLAYNPHHGVDTVLLTFENHWHCSAWTETRTVIVISYPETQIVPPPPLVGNCKPVTEAALFLVDTCSTLVIDSVDIPQGILSRLRLSTSLPDTIHAGLSDSLFFTFDPYDTIAHILDSVEIFGHYPGMDSALAYFDFRAIEGFPSHSLTSIDQFVPIKLIALPSGIALFSEDSAIALPRASYCERIIDTTVTFTNKGCTPDTILQIAMTGLGYSMPTTPLPIIIPPDSSVTFDLNFAATDTGVVQGAFQLTAVSNDTNDFSLPLTGIGFPHTGILSMPTASLDAGSFSICSGDTLVMDTLSNTGCDTLSITNLLVVGDADFTIINSNTGSQIPPDSILIVTVHFKPLAKGSRSAYVSFHSANVSGVGPSLDTTFTLHGIGLHGTMILAANTASLDVGATYVCQEVDTFAILQNVGCDTVCVSGVSVDSSDFLITGGAGTFCLSPGAIDTIFLHTQIDTVGGTKINIDSLTIASDAIPPFAPVVLSREIQYPAQWELHLSPPDSAVAGTDVIFRVIQSGTLPPDVTTLDFTLAYDDDLLRFVSADEPTVHAVSYTRTGDGLAHESFQVAPVGSDSVVATLHFYPYVTSSSQTEVGLDNLNIVSSENRAQDCIASIRTASTAFTLMQACGSSELSEFLKSGTVVINTIDPNPASGTIMLGVSSGVASVTFAELSIVDALGRMVSRQEVVLTIGGGNQFQVNIEHLPSGIYAAQLRGGGFASTREFVKE